MPGGEAVQFPTHSKCQKPNLPNIYSPAENWAALSLPSAANLLNFPPTTPADEPNIRNISSPAGIWATFPVPLGVILFAQATGATEAMGLQPLLREVGVDLPIVVYTDSSAERSVMHRLGHGRPEHVKTRYFFMLSLMQEKKPSVEQVLGAQHPGEIGTKALTSSVPTYLTGKAGMCTPLSA